MLTLTEAAEQIRTRRISPLELTRECLSRIERLNPILNAFITVTGELALEQARQAEAEVMAGKWRGPLHGIPIGLKDLLDVSGVRTTAASNQFCNRIATDDAEIVKLLKHSGAVIVGKLNLHEFAFGMSGIVSAFGPVKNPWDKERITGGSSSGSAAAVAAGMCVASIGSDTAGSIRCPAALCGIVGHRPSAGLLSAEGMIPLAPSFDTAGPMTQNVRDAAVLLEILSGTPVTAELDASVSRLRIGVPRRGFFDDLQAEVQTCLEEALAVVRELVAEVRDVPLAVARRRTVFDAEIYEYHEKMATQTPQLYAPATLVRVEKCAGISATDYIRARRELQQQRRAAESVFEHVDLLITPTTPVTAPQISQLMPLGEPRLRDFETKYLLRNTTPFSYLYWPSTSVPCGFTAEGLPVGIQISGRPGQDAAVLRLANAYEQATEWHKNNKEDKDRIGGR
ncbi:MAG TPA: amidase [Terriglobales bacterium]|nr:amidase [Terriglobales bacterium]